MNDSKSKPKENGGIEKKERTKIVKLLESEKKEGFLNYPPEGDTHGNITIQMKARKNMTRLDTDELIEDRAALLSIMHGAERANTPHNLHSLDLTGDNHSSTDSLEIPVTPEKSPLVRDELYEKYKKGDHIISRQMNNPDHPLAKEALYWDKNCDHLIPPHYVKHISDAYEWLETIPAEIQKELKEKVGFSLQLSQYPYIAAHGFREAIDGGCLGLAFNKIITRKNTSDPINIKALMIGLLFHDVGKLHPRMMEIAKLERDLKDDEYEEIKQHPDIGHHAFSKLTELLINTEHGRFLAQEEIEIIKHIIKYHHVWIDHQNKRSYPKIIDPSLNNQSNSIYAQIATIVDAVDAMTSRNTGRKRGLSNEKKAELAINELKEYSGSQFQPQLVNLYLRLGIKTTFYNPSEAKATAKYYNL